MLCFTKEMNAGGCESRRCQTAGAGYGRRCSRCVRSSPHCSGGLDVVRSNSWWRHAIGKILPIKGKAPRKCKLHFPCLSAPKLCENVILHFLDVENIIT